MPEDHPWTSTKETDFSEEGTGLVVNTERPGERDVIGTKIKNFQEGDTDPIVSTLAK